MTRVANIHPYATTGHPQRLGYIHHSKILQCSVFGVQCSMFSPRTHQSDPQDNWYIYHSDHLGSSAFLTDASGTPTQHLQYLPFGEPFIEQRSVTEYYTPYIFSAKERDLETGYSYFGARYYDATLSIWLSVDPLAHKYPSMSAYMYCAGNPVMLVDPDGKDLVIWYIDSDNSRKSFTFNGSNASEAPENQFVKSVLEAYEYNVKNGGGLRMQTAAQDSRLKLNIYQSDRSRANVSSNGHAVMWNPIAGLLTEQGDVLSPATVLEHEIDHALHKYEVGMLEHNRGVYTPDSQYGNAEERRVITGSEKHTGTRNGEFKRSTQRTSHRGATVIVPNSISTRADKQKSIEYWQNQDRNSPHGLDISGRIRLINKYLR
jgi:RHS repeat-associated protein